MVVVTKEDFECLPAATDSLTELAWSPTADYLAVGSWDGQTRVYEVMGTTRSVVPKTAVAHEGPVFSCSWSPDGTKMASVGADKSIRILDLAAGGQTLTTPAAHEAPIRLCRFALVNGMTVLATGSWDRTLKYWQVATGTAPTPIGTVQLPERVYAMDVFGSMLVVGTAERHVLVFDLAHNPMAPALPSALSPLKMQTRCIAAFPDGQGFAIGSIEGRVGLQYPHNPANHFAFKCHRDTVGNTAYAVNAIAFNPVCPAVFCTAGSDGGIHFWDKDSKQRVDSFAGLPLPVTSVAFNRDGLLFAYAISYDWSKGHEGYVAGGRASVMIHRVGEEGKPRGMARRR